MKRRITCVDRYSDRDKLHLACWLDTHQDESNPPLASESDDDALSHRSFLDSDRVVPHGYSFRLEFDRDEAAEL